MNQLRDDACVAERVQVREVTERRHRGNTDGDRETRRAGDAVQEQTVSRTVTVGSCHRMRRLRRSAVCAER
eukprot:1136839-Prymnesium_polylepis.1